MIKQSEYFVYNGVNSKDLGITQVQVSLQDLYKEQFMGDVTIQEVQIRHKHTPYFQGMLRTPLSFDLTFAFDEVANPGSLKAISQAFWVDSYVPFWTSDDPNRIWYCQPNGSSDVNHNGLGQGYVTMTMRCDSPYMYMPTVSTEEYDFSEQDYTESAEVDFETGKLTNVVATDGATTPTIGLQLPSKSPMSFTRNSTANDPVTLAIIPLNQPRFVSGKFGNGILVEEGTTNLVENSDFETVTTTAQVFNDALTSYTGTTVPAPWTLQSGSFGFRNAPTTNLVENSDFETVTTTATLFADALTSYTGSTVPAPWTLQSGSFGFRNAPTTNLVENSDFETVTTTAQLFSDALTSYTGSTVPAPWTLQSGSFTFGASGATSGANGAHMVAGNSMWKPVLGSDGTTKLALTTQATFTQPTTVPTNVALLLFFLDSSGSRYEVYSNGATLYLAKLNGATLTNLSTVAQALSASTSYCATLSLDNTGLLTAKLYQGTDTTGTLLQTLTATDTSLTGGFQIGVGGDTGVVISNASVTGPWANGWLPQLDTGAKGIWALTSGYSGKYGMSVSNYGTSAAYVRSPSGAEATGGYAVSPSTTYSVSGYVNTLGLNSGSAAALRIIEWNASGGVVKDWLANIASTSLQNNFTRISGSFTTSQTTATVTIRPEISDSGTVTFDSIQLETGSTMNNYVRNDSTTGSATVPAGATSGGTGAVMTAGNAQWKPLLGSDGTTKLALTAQSNFAQPATVGDMLVRLYVDSNDYYELNCYGGYARIVKKSSGSSTNLNYISYTAAASTTYTLMLKLDNTGVITATITPSGGSTTTLTATDSTPLTGGFLIGVGGDTGVVIKSTSVTGPWANGWTIGGDSRVAWALSQNAISGKYSPCAVGVGKNVNGLTQMRNITASASTPYIASVYVNTLNIGTSGVWVRVGDGVNNHDSAIVSGTTSTNRISDTFTTASSSTSMILSLEVNDSGTVTFDSIQLETGSTMNNYVRNDSTTGSATVPAGATSGATQAQMTAGNAQWKPVLGSDGTTKLALTAQATFTQPESGTAEIVLGLYQGSGTWMAVPNYLCYVSGGAFFLAKNGGVGAGQFDSVGQTLLPSTSYTMTLSLDNTGLLTGKIYRGTDTSGTLLQTLTATDTTVTGGFLVGIGADTGVIVSNVSVTGPWANGWSIGGDSRVSWALSQNAINGKYSPCAVGVSNGVNGYALSTPANVSASQSYTVSGYMSLSNVGSGGAWITEQFDGSVSGTNTPVVSGTKVASRYSATIATGVGATSSHIYLTVNDSGTVTFDSIQLEQKAYATSYMRNDSTSASATRSAETLTLPASVLNASKGTIAFWAYEDGVNHDAYLVDTDNHEVMLYKHGTQYVVYVNNLGVISGVPLSSIGLHFYTVKWSGTSISLYIDGILSKTGTSTNAVSLSGVTNVYIGSSYAGTSQWNNVIDEFTVYNYDLSDSEVSSLYNSASAATITEDMNVLAHFDSNLTYGQGGYRITNELDLPLFTNETSSRISWTANTPTDTNVTVMTSLDGGRTWQTATNGGTIPNLVVGENLTGKTLMIKESLTTTDVSVTPLITTLEATEDGTFVITNNGDITCPFEIWITKIGEGDVSVINTSDNNNTISFTGLSDQEMVYVDTDAEYITSSLEESENIYRYDNFNDNYMLLALGASSFQVIGSCKVQFQFTPRLVQGM